MHTISKLIGSLLVTASLVSATPAIDPAAETLFQQYLASVGGAEAFTALTHTRTEGTVAMPAMGLSGTSVTHTAPGGRFHMVMVLPGLGETVMAYDGTRGWTTSELTGDRWLAPEEIAETRRTSDFASLTRLSGFMQSAALGPTEVIDGVTYDTIVGVGNTGAQETLLFDATSKEWRFWRTTITMESLGKLPLTIAFENYQPYGTLRLPNLLTARNPAFTMVMRTTSFTTDSVPPASLWEVPASLPDPQP